MIIKSAPNSINNITRMSSLWRAKRLNPAVPVNPMADKIATTGSRVVEPEINVIPFQPEEQGAMTEFEPLPEEKADDYFSKHEKWSNRRGKGSRTPIPDEIKPELTRAAREIHQKLGSVVPYYLAVAYNLPEPEIKKFLNDLEIPISKPHQHELEETTEYYPPIAKGGIDKWLENRWGQKSALPNNPVLEPEDIDVEGNAIPEREQFNAIGLNPRLKNWGGTTHLY